VPPPTPAAAPKKPGLFAGPQHRFVRMALGFYGIVFLFAFGYALFSGTIATLFGEQYPSGGSVLFGIFVGLGIVGVCQMGLRTLPWIRRSADTITELVGPITYPGVVAVALASGIAEELLFRGALWIHLDFMGTSFLFAIVHVVPRRSMIGYPVFAFGAGLLLGLLRHASGNAIPSMFAHVIVNGLNLGYLEWRRRRGLALAPRPS
jgi:membrane protease YdiL (CAAX protease family)